MIMFATLDEQVKLIYIFMFHKRHIVVFFWVDQFSIILVGCLGFILCLNLVLSHNIDNTIKMAYR